jgi:hypothetical protein
MYKLSKIQKKILRYLFELGTESLETSELIFRVYDVDAPSEFRNLKDSRFPNATWHRRNEEDWKAYNSLHASLSRSVARLKERGLIKQGDNQQPYAISLVLTERGSRIAKQLEPLPVTEKWKHHLKQQEMLKDVFADLQAVLGRRKA